MGASEDSLTAVTEEASLSVVTGVARRGGARCGRQGSDSSPEERGRRERCPAAGPPDIARNGLLGKYQRTHRPPSKYINQRRVPALMGCKIISREAHGVPAGVVVHREVSPCIIPAVQGSISD